MYFDEKKQQIEEQKKEFCDLLRSTNREGVEYVIEDLENLGFITTPVSTRPHQMTRA